MAIFPENVDTLKRIDKFKIGDIVVVDAKHLPNDFTINNLIIGHIIGVNESRLGEFRFKVYIARTDNIENKSPNELTLLSNVVEAIELGILK